MKKVFLLFLISIFVLILGGCSKNQATQQVIPSELAFQSYSGETITLDSYIGIPLVINSWASWCSFCVDELPDFNALQKEFGEQIQIIAINRQESLGDAQKFTSDLGLNNGILFLLDSKDLFYKFIQGFSMPETIFVNKDGEIVYHKRGIMSNDEIRQRINNLLHG